MKQTSCADSIVNAWTGHWHLSLSLRWAASPSRLRAVGCLQSESSLWLADQTLTHTLSDHQSDSVFKDSHPVSLPVPTLQQPVRTGLSTWPSRLAVCLACVTTSHRLLGRLFRDSDLRLLSWWHQEQLLNWRNTNCLYFLYFLCLVLLLQTAADIKTMTSSCWCRVSSCWSLLVPAGSLIMNSSWRSWKHLKPHVDLNTHTGWKFNLSNFLFQ